MVGLTFFDAYEIFIFDFDGTLVDSNHIKYQGFFEATRSIQGAHELLRNILSENVSKTRTEIFAELADVLDLRNIAEASTVELVRRYSSYCRDRVVTAMPIKGAQEMLEGLRKNNKRVFLSSATPESELKDLVEQRGWRRLFERVYGAPGRKDNHIASIKIETRSHASKILVCGDSIGDLVTASEAGCDFVGIGVDLSRFAGHQVTMFADFEEWAHVLRGPHESI